MPRRKKPKSGIVTIYDTSQPIYECVAIDVNTQQDFLKSDGAIPVANLDDILPKIKKIFSWAKKHKVPIISPTDIHRPGTEKIKSPLFHCIEGTPGQKKLAFTLFPKRYVIEHNSSDLSLPGNLLGKYRQIIIHKRTNDVFTNPRADRFFSEIQSKRMIVFGVGAERAIKMLVLGLLSRCKHPIVIKDACGYWDKESADLALRQVEAKGAVMITTEELIKSKPEELPVPHIEISSLDE